MEITAFSAMWFLPFVLPLCFYTAYTDMAMMRITNPTVLALALVFIIVGLIALPLDIYLWRLSGMVIVLILGMLFNAAGALGAGDAKFAAAAAPFIAFGDLRLVMALFAATLLAAVILHRIVKYSPLRNLVPHWASWDQDKKFPMGLALGATLAFYLLLGWQFGA